MDNPISDLTDAAFEQLENVKNSAVDEVKTAPKTIKSQIFDNSQNPPTDEKTPVKDAKKPKVDPVTGKPIPTKKILTQLNQATAQLAQARIKKLREDLDKQRLKTTSAKSPNQPVAGQPWAGKPVKKDDAVAQTLKASKETGEFKGLIGG